MVQKTQTTASSALNEANARATQQAGDARAAQKQKDLAAAREAQIIEQKNKETEGNGGNLVNVVG